MARILACTVGGFWARARFPRLAARTLRTSRHGTLVILTIAAMSWPLAATAGKDETAPITARSGLEAARDAARSWAADARLVYLENDENVGPDGTATRWGYLFFSEGLGTTRGYSVRDGRLEEASDLGFDFEAPPVSDDWIDSGAALVAAEKKAGARYRTESGGHLATMLLIRGAFHDEKPDETTWALVYTADHAPALFVVIDAKNGDVVKTWRG